MIKSKLELMLEAKFDLVDKDDDFYLVSKDFLNEDKRNKAVIAVRYNEQSDDDKEIIITASSVDSLFNQKHSEIEFMLGYYSFEGISVQDVLTNKEKYEIAIVYADLYEDGYYDEVEMISLSDKETIKEIDGADFWQNSTVLIVEILDVLSSLSPYNELSQKLQRDTLQNRISIRKDDLLFETELGLILEVINTGWESLNFESRTSFAELSGEIGSIILETNGEVAITDIESNNKYTGNHVFENQEITNLISSGNIYTSERYVVHDNNWFSLSFINKEDKYVDDLVFESEPETIDELVSEMKKAYDYFTELEKETEEKSEYLVSVKESFCFDGQIVESKYCLDLEKTDDICPHDYYKKDFYGEFILGVFEATSKKEVIKLVSEVYEMEEKMLQAYKLA